MQASSQLWTSFDNQPTDLAPKLIEVGNVPSLMALYIELRASPVMAITLSMRSILDRKSVV